MNIAIISGSRADWSGLGMLAKALNGRAECRIAALSLPAADAVVADGLVQALPRHWPDETPDHVNVVLSEDWGMAGELTRRLEAIAPDLAVVCGDRHEIMVAAFVCAMKRIPLAHIAGGDVTGGSLDERWRHAITKIADIHFPTHQEAAARILRMGEDPAHVHCLGSPAVDRLLSVKLFDAGETRLRLGLQQTLESPRGPFLLVNFQASSDTLHALPQMLAALTEVALPVVMVGTNAEAESYSIEKVAKDWASRQVFDVVWRQSLTPTLYLSALKHCAALVGNSSSGYYEAPYFATPVIDIGSRQSGRMAPVCLANVLPDVAQIAAAIRHLHVADQDFREVPEHLYGDGNSAQKIAEVLLSYEGRMPRGKQFHD